MVDVTTGKTVASRNSNMCAIPASITKIITTATALELLGPDFRFETHIEIDGTLTADGTLNGNLIIRGGADPTLGSIFLGNRNFISDFASAIQRYGIKRINGDIISDPNCLNTYPVPLKWSWEDLGTHYGTGAYGLSAYDNTSIITLKSGGHGSKPQIIGIWPELNDMVTINNIEIPHTPKDSIVVMNAPYSKMRIMQGCMSPDKNNYIVKSSISNPPLLVAEYLAHELNDRGINVNGRARVIIDSIYNPTDTVHRNLSQPLSEIIKLTNFKSNNLYAELTFRRLGCLNMPQKATSEASVAEIKKFLSSIGIDIFGLFVYDGCGLSPHNAFSADLLTQLLLYMYNSNYSSYFINSMPIAGKEGTVGAFLRKTPLEGKAHIKSGSMSNVQCYSGYITPESGRTYAFTVMINNYNGNRRDVKKIIEHWLIRDAK